MLKFLLILSLCVHFSFASEKETATKIVQAITSVVNVSDKNVWIEKKDKSLHEFLDTKNFKASQRCEDVGVLLVMHANLFASECKGKPIVVLDYDLLKRYDNAVAAFFWKKGRPNIVFIKDRVEKFKIKLPPSYEIYQEDEIW